MDRDLEEAIASVRSWVDASDRVVVLTGAGISTDSGIPDFRGPKGVWTRNPAAEKLATYDHYVGDPEVRKLAWQSRLELRKSARRSERGTPRGRRTGKAGKAAPADHPEHRRIAHRRGIDARADG